MIRHINRTLGPLRAMLWKDFRSHTCFALLTAVCGVVLVVVTVKLLAVRAAWRVGPVVGILSMMAWIAHVFCSERVDRTIALLQRVGISMRLFWVTRVVLGLVVGLGLFELMWFVGCCTSNFDINGPNREEREALIDLFSKSPWFFAAACMLTSSVFVRRVSACAVAIAFGAATLAAWEFAGSEYATFLPGQQWMLLFPASFVVGSYLEARRWLVRPAARAWVPALPCILSVGYFAAAIYWINWGSVPDAPLPFDVEAFLADGVPESENAARIYRQAFDASPDQGEGEAGDRTPAQRRIRELWRGIYMREDLDESWAAVEAPARKYLQAADRALRLARQASGMERAEFNPPNQIDFSFVLDASTQQREMMRTVLLKARQTYHNGQHLEAANWLLALMRMARHIEHRRGLLETVMAEGFDRSAIHGLIQVLDAPGWTTEEVARIRDEFEAIAAQQAPIVDTLKFEYLENMYYLNPVHDQEWGWKSLTPDGFTHPLTLIEFRKTEYAFNRSFAIVIKALERLDYETFNGDPGLSQHEVAELDALAGVSHWTQMLGDIGVSFGRKHKSLVHTNLWFLRLRQYRLDVGRTVLALTLWKKRHGEWPDSLEQLVPKYLPAVPLDPYSDQPAPMLYKLVPTQGLVYLDRDGNVIDDTSGSGIGAPGMMAPGMGAPDMEGDGIDEDGLGMNPGSFPRPARKIAVEPELAAAGPKIRMLYSRGPNRRDDGGLLMYAKNFSDFGDWLIHLPSEPIPADPPPTRDYNTPFGFSPDF